ncbi:hypothetical protein PspLS_10824 [Pyricularia sp. CBS 133598]|nr:hypothetical protein PspLS_10824 [Pyricularia sp. CBS 133598]
MALSLRPSPSNDSESAPDYDQKISIMIQRNDPKLDLVRHEAAEILDAIRRDYAPSNVPELGTIPIAPGQDVRLDLSDPIDGILLAGAWVLHLLVRAVLLELTDTEESLETTRNLAIVLVKVCRTFMAHHRSNTYVFRDLLVTRLLEATYIASEINRPGQPRRLLKAVERVLSRIMMLILNIYLKETCKAVLSRMLRDMGVHSLDDWRTPTDEYYCLWLFGSADLLTRGSG